MTRRIRLDTELVRRGLARSRAHAAELVAAGRVRVRGTAAHKPATMVDPADPVLVGADEPGIPHASRGGHKLAGALATFGEACEPNRGHGGEACEPNRGHGGEACEPNRGHCGPSGLRVTGRRCLDAGAAAGGFTDVLLRAGAAEVVAVDVGYGQLAWALRTDPRVRVHERTNVRTLTPDAIGGPVELTVADLSFISLRLVLPALAGATVPDGDLVLMVKPQFEVGKGRVGAGGVVRDPALRAEAVRGVAQAGTPYGLGVAGIAPSPLPGPAGNVEVFLWLRRGAPPLDPDELRAAVPS